MIDSIHKKIINLLWNDFSLQSFFKLKMLKRKLCLKTLGLIFLNKPVKNFRNPSTIHVITTQEN